MSHESYLSTCFIDIRVTGRNNIRYVESYWIEDPNEINLTEICCIHTCEECRLDNNQKLTSYQVLKRRCKF